MKDSFNQDMFASRLRGRRAELGWTQEELAEKAGISASTLVKYEKGVGGFVPGLERFVSLARSLHTTPNHLLGIDEQSH